MTTMTTTSNNDDILIPNFNDTIQRKSTLIVAIFNLSATVIGGGVLSLPYAFSKAGLILGSLLMMIAAIITERTLYLLCLSSRITGAITYGEIGEVAYGKYMEYFISFLLGIFLLFVIVGYMVLVKDIHTSLLTIIIDRMTMSTTSSTSSSSPTILINERIVLAIVILLISPFLIQKTLHALRFNCYIGFASVSILCLALVHHAWIGTSSTTSITNTLLWSTNLEDVLIAFPIITLSFLSIFNVLPIQNALLKPTRTRILLSIDGAMISCFALTTVFGLAGYLYAGKGTNGNILNNCDSANDFIMLLGHTGCAITIMLAMPMMLLPCRASLLEVLDVLVNGAHKTPIEEEEEDQEQEETSRLLTTTTTTNDIDKPSYQSTVTFGNSEKEKMSLQGNFHRRKFQIIDNNVIHIVSTILIVLTCYVVAINIPGVEVVWSIIGCFMGYLLSFMLPCLCYLKIQLRYPEHTLRGKSWIWFSKILLIASIVASIACTIETIKRLS